MNAHQSTSPEAAPSAGKSRTGDLLVLGAMAIVATAAAVAVAVQGGVPVGGAVGAGCALFAIFVAAHALRTAPAAKAQPARTRKVRRVPVARAPEAQPPVLPRLDGEAGETRRPAGSLPDSVDVAEIPDAALGSLAPALPEAPPAMADEAPPLPEPSLAEVAPALAPYAPPPVDPMQSYWSYAPGAPRFEGSPYAGMPSQRVLEAQAAQRSASAMAGFEHGPTEAAAMPAAPVEPPPLAGLEAGHGEASPTAPRREDVEVIQSLIKKLADEVNAAEQMQARGQLMPPPVPPSAGLPLAPGRMASPPPLPEASIEASLAALRTTASTMRRGDVPRFDGEEATIAAASERSRFVSPPSHTPPPAPSPASVPVAGNARAATFSEALSAGRMEVLLEPIMGLDDNRARHYEVTVRLRSAAGEVLSPDDHRSELEGARILPLIDAMKIVRTATVAQRLGERGKDGSVFSSYAGESLADSGFLSEVAGTIRSRPAAAGQLVLSFTQGDVRGFEAPEWGALAELKALGFRFALSDVTDLDMDFDVLAKCGFSFAKLDADVFLDGLMAPSGLVPASDVCRHLASEGLTLVVDRIDSDFKRARIFGFGVLFGQGQLFGVPRPMKVEAVQGHRDAAA